ncbi:MAG: DNA primase [Methanocellales archaeon]
MRDEERLKEIELLMNELRNDSKKGAIILVEGKKDERALRDLGIEGMVVVASHYPLLQISDKMANDGVEIVLLTDWDKKGDLIAEKISTYLSALGRNVNLRIRTKLGDLIKKDVKEVENLPSYIARLRIECRLSDE